MKHSNIVFNSSGLCVYTGNEMNDNCCIQVYYENKPVKAIYHGDQCITKFFDDYRHISVDAAKYANNNMASYNGLFYKGGWSVKFTFRVNSLTTADEVIIVNNLEHKNYYGNRTDSIDEIKRTNGWKISIKKTDDTEDAKFRIWYTTCWQDGFNGSNLHGTATVEESLSLNEDYTVVFYGNGAQSGNNCNCKINNKDCTVTRYRMYYVQANQNLDEHKIHFGAQTAECTQKDKKWKHDTYAVDDVDVRFIVDEEHPIQIIGSATNNEGTAYVTNRVHKITVNNSSSASFTYSYKDNGKWSEWETPRDADLPKFRVISCIPAWEPTSKRIKEESNIK